MGVFWLSPVEKIRVVGLRESVLTRLSGAPPYKTPSRLTFLHIDRKPLLFDEPHDSVLDTHSKQGKFRCTFC